MLDFRENQFLQALLLITAVRLVTKLHLVFVLADSFRSDVMTRGKGGSV